MPSVSWNRAEFSARLQEDLGRKLPYAVVMALTWTAKDIEAEGRRSWMPRTFDRPTRWTLNSMRTRPATKTSMWAEVLFKDANTQSIDGDRHYLLPQVRGGGRTHTPFEARLIRASLMRQNEYAMPARGLRLDAHGNVPRGIAARIFAQIGGGDAGYNSRESAASRARRSRRNVGSLFIPEPGANLARGIWERKGRSILPLFIFVQRRPNYRAIFKWKIWADDLAERRMPVNFRRAAERVLSWRK